ncbi:hypothetical protein V5O48_007303 [Marasmius crinis-equi]|uniref:Uncharacterized protein n=1 Tax=Marasmius crinis-equi TaxID=585013 RepID=A0ABR3FHJ9_9AGAR
MTSRETSEYKQQQSKKVLKRKQMIWRLEKQVEELEGELGESRWDIQDRIKRLEEENNRLRLENARLRSLLGMAGEAVDGWRLTNRYRILDLTHWLSRGQKLAQTLKDTISLDHEIESYQGTMRGTILSFIGANPFKEQIQRQENELRGLRDYFIGCSGPGRWNFEAGSSNYIEKHGDDFTNSTVGRTSRDVHNYHGTTYNTYN